jgi:hypothetical protein
MKKIIFVFTVLIVVFNFISCSSDKTEITKPDKQTQALYEFSKQFVDIEHIDFKVMRIQNSLGDNISEELKSIAKSSDINNAFNMVVQTEVKGKVELNSIVYEYSENDKEVRVAANYKDDTGVDLSYDILLERIDEEHYRILSHNLLSEYPSALKSCDYSGAAGYWSCVSICIGCMLDTKHLAGQIISISGALGSIGCKACGIVGASLFAIGALGCLGC